MNINDSEKKNDFVRAPIQSLHTLDGDILSSIKDENYGSNIVKVITHDTDKKGFQNQTENIVPETETVQKSSFSIKFNFNSIYFYVGLSVFLLSILGGVTYYVVRTSINQTIPKVDVATSTEELASSTVPLNIAIAQNTIFNAEVVIPIEISNLTKVQILDLIEKTKKSLVANEIKDNINISLPTGADLSTFFNKIQYSGPDTLMRSITSDKIYNFGLYHKRKGDFEVYTITQISGFDLAFSGMLEWERTIPVDFYKVYTYTPLLDPDLATTSTSNSNTAKFTDKVIKNIDVRVYTDISRNTQIIYGFINKKYLLITSGEASFVDIVNKLTVNNILR